VPKNKHPVGLGYGTLPQQGEERFRAAPTSGSAVRNNSPRWLKEQALLLDCNLILRKTPRFYVSPSRGLALIVLGAFGSALVSASIGVSVLYATHVQAYSGLGSAWLIYWLGDSTGVLLVTPLVLTFPNLLRIRPQVRVAELAALLLLLTVACFIVFGDVPFIPVRLHVLAFAVLPFVIWAAIRFGVSGATLATLIVATIATVETALGSGPFAQNTPFTNAVLLDVFFAVLSVSGMTLAAVIAEREQGEREREQLSSCVQAFVSFCPTLNCKFLSMDMGHVFNLRTGGVSCALVLSFFCSRQRFASHPGVIKSQ
jgi:MASE1